MSVHMRRLEDNGQRIQPGNQLMIKMVQRGNQRIDEKPKSHKMKKCLTQIQGKKLVSIKLYFTMFIQGHFTFLVKIYALTQSVRHLKVLANIKTIFRFLPYQLVEVSKT